MDFTTEQKEWISTNQLLFTSNVSVSREQVKELFALLSHMTGKTQRPTGCSRCIKTALRQIWVYYSDQLKREEDDAQ
jgi:hypothetical protein